MIGRQPIKEKLTITPGQDFSHEVQPPSPYQFQAGTTLKIVLFEGKERGANEVTAWPANVTPESAAWIIQSDVTDLLPTEERLWFRLYISYPDSPTTDHCWFSGPVIYSP